MSYRGAFYPEQVRTDRIRPLQLLFSGDPMSPYEAAFFWIAVCLYGITSALYIYAFVFKKESIFGRIPYFIAVSLAFHTAAALARYAAVGNLPVAGDYENSVGQAWFIVAITLYLSVRHPALRAVGVATLPLSLLMLGYGVMRGAELAPMHVSVRSVWLYVHVFFAWLAFGAYAIASGLSILYLKREKNPDKEFYQKLPDLPTLDDLMFRYLIFGFITDAVMIGAGAIWAKNLWGNYWSWEPVEMWSLLTW